MSAKPLDCVAVKGDGGKHDFVLSPTEPIIHGTAEPRAAGERYCSEKIAELVMTQSQLAKAIAERDALEAALSKAAADFKRCSEAFDDYKYSRSSYTAFCMASEAERTLAKLASGELRKPAA